MRTRVWKWISVGALAIALVVVLIWVTRVPIPQTQPGTTTSSTAGSGGIRDRATAHTGEAAAGKPEIVRAPHSLTPSASKEAAVVAPPATPGEALSMPNRTPGLVRQTPAQLNRGVGKLGNVAVDGEMAVATVVTPDNNTYELAPNQVGRFERIYLNEKDTITAQVRYPQARDGEVVVVSVLDGGKLDEGRQARQHALDSKHTLAFTFQATDQVGLHRVRLTKGADQKILDFWVGEVPPPAPPLAQAMNMGGN